MQNDGEVKNGLDPVDAYLRDVGLWRERLERQRLEIIGHVQRKLHELVEKIADINQRGGFEITMHDECFQKDLRALGLEVVGAPEKKPMARGPYVKRGSVLQKFDEFLSMYKPGEMVTREDWGKYGKKDQFYYNAARCVKRGKLLKRGPGCYTIP